MGRSGLRVDRIELDPAHRGVRPATVAAPRRDVNALLDAAGLDPSQGVQVVAADRLASVPFDPGLPLLILRSSDDAVDPLPGRHARRTTTEVLAALYPRGHGLRNLATGDDVALEDLTDAVLRADRFLVRAAIVARAA